MSENPIDPDFSSLPEDDEELEALLKKLDPAPMECSRRDDLHREYRITAATKKDEKPTRVLWGRVVPIAAACCLATFAYVSFRYGPTLEPETESTVATETSRLREVGSLEELAPLSPVGPSAKDFVPVSAQGYLIDASSRGVVETKDGPRERMAVEYRDAYHWHDPESGTNIRFFKPRSEEVIVPLQTD